MINKAGATVVASSASVAFAIMDKGGSLNSLLQANLADGSSSNVWPISGFTYFVIRNKHHIAPGNCARRSAAMEYLYNFYNSATVAISAQELGFAALPSFVASIIVQHLVDNALCDNGQYALQKYRTTPSPILTTTVFKSVVSEYLSAYTAVDPTASWGFTYSDDSSRYNFLLLSFILCFLLSLWSVHIFDWNLSYEVKHSLSLPSYLLISLYIYTYT